MFQLIRTDPPADQVRRITFVPFLADGRCVLIEEPGGPALPAGDVQDGEDYPPPVSHQPVRYQPSGRRSTRPGWAPVVPSANVPARAGCSLPRTTYPTRSGMISSAGLAAAGNLLWMMFTDSDNRARMTTWDRAARVLLSQFRAAAGRHPGDPRFAELVEALTEASPQFRDWWAEYPVRYFRPATIRIRHPQAGRITLEMFQLRLEDDPGLLMVDPGPGRPRQPRPCSRAARPALREMPCSS